MSIPTILYAVAISVLVLGYVVPLIISWWRGRNRCDGMSSCAKLNQILVTVEETNLLLKLLLSGFVEADDPETVDKK